MVKKKKGKDDRNLFIIINFVMLYLAHESFPSFFYYEDGSFKKSSFALALPGTLVVSAIIYVLLLMLYSLFFDKPDNDREKFFDD